MYARERGSVTRRDDVNYDRTGCRTAYWHECRVMDDESGESMELMEEMPLKELGEAELERLVHG